MRRVIRHDINYLEEKIAELKRIYPLSESQQQAITIGTQVGGACRCIRECVEFIRREFDVPDDPDPMPLSQEQIEAYTDGQSLKPHRPERYVEDRNADARHEWNRTRMSRDEMKGARR